MLFRKMTLLRLKKRKRKKTTANPTLQSFRVSLAFGNPIRRRLLPRRRESSLVLLCFSFVLLSQSSFAAVVHADDTLLSSSSSILTIGAPDGLHSFRSSIMSPLVSSSLSSSQSSSSSSSSQLQRVSFGVILPKTSLITIQRQYYKRLQHSVESLINSKSVKYNFTNYYRISDAPLVLMSHSPSPNEILDTLCGPKGLLVRDVSAIIYMTNSETFAHNGASTQYLMQLTGYLGIPMIAWNADNSGLHQPPPESRVLQLAPTVEHQADAMLSILQRYSWHSFSILTSTMGGYTHFIRAIRDAAHSSTNFKFNILSIVTLKAKSRGLVQKELEALAESETRVILLYCNKREAKEVMAAAQFLKMTSKHYAWIASQSVIGSAPDHVAPNEYPPGMLAIHYNTSHNRLLDEIERAVTIFGNGLEQFVNDSPNHLIPSATGTGSSSSSSSGSGSSSSSGTLIPGLNCNASGDSGRWSAGDKFFKYLRNVSIPIKHSDERVEFNSDGTLKFVELDVMNLNIDGYWDTIGHWTKSELIIKDITWPEKSPVPPRGVPEKFNLKLTFLEEPPFVNLGEIDHLTGQCKTRRAVKCRYASANHVSRTVDNSKGQRHHSSYYDRCCSGFCIDLLQKFVEDIGFTYELYRVEDGAWGAVLSNNTWNGLVAELLNHKADAVVTSLKINSDRQNYVDFTVPFLETGITIVVAKRTGIISPKAFLEPFDVISWIMILLVSIQVAAFAIFLFEWLSPSGYNMQMIPRKDHKFSLFRTYWLVWAILFGAAVPINCPRGYTAKFMSNVWATFAVVFLAIYTANLAAFMITREDFYDFTGLEDPRLANPHHTSPPLRFGTIPHGNTEAVLKKNKPQMQAYMKKFNRSSSVQGVTAVKRGELDAFIYDAVVMDYLTGQDSDCRLLTVGSWYAMTGYGFAFPKNSKYLAKFNEKMIEYRESGDLERLRKFWLQGACKANRRKGKVSKPLDVNQFMSAFLLLGCGILLTILLLVLEHIYFRYCRKYLSKSNKDGCFTLISLSMARSLSFQSAVTRTQESISQGCVDPMCVLQSMKLKRELDLLNSQLNMIQSSKEYQESKVRSNTGNQNCQNQFNVATKDEDDTSNQQRPRSRLRMDPSLAPTYWSPVDNSTVRDLTRDSVESNDPFLYRSPHDNRYYKVCKDPESHFKLKDVLPRKQIVPEVETVL